MNTGKIGLAPLAVLMTAFFMSTASTAADPKSYPLVCKGGGSTRLTILPTPNVSLMSWDFKKGTGPASAGLRSGQCSWMDRAMGDGARSILKFSSVNVFVRVTVDNGQRISYLADYDQADSQAKARADKVQYVLEAITSGKEFIVHVSPRGNKGLKVTKIGP